MQTAIAWLLNAAYLAVLAALGPVIAWTAWRTGKYRQGRREKLLGLAPKREGDRRCVWMHAVSVGEVNLLGVLLRELRRRRPEWEFVVSTTTRAGMELAKKKYGAEGAVFYCPLDFSWATHAAVHRLRPDLLLLAELELWPNLIAAAKSHGCRVAVFNGRLSENSYRGYRRVRPLVRWVLRKVDLVAAQDAASAERFRSLGAPAERVVVTGSLKYDGAETDRDNPRTLALRRLAGIAAGTPVWLAGSTQAPEEEIIVSLYNKIVADFPALRLILVPRHPERFEEVAALLRRSGLAFWRRSALQDPAPIDPPSVLLVDVVGELGAWWGLATLGFVGGSFGDRGGQNMIEPAAYGVATSFGPNTRNFRDIVAALLAAGGAVQVADPAELEALVRRLLSEPSYAEALGHSARRLVASQLGATGRTADLLEGLMADQAPLTQGEAA